MRIEIRRDANLLRPVSEASGLQIKRAGRSLALSGHETCR
jgi:hypothetical protein